MIIYFEGLSGAGKSTIIDSIQLENLVKIPEFINKPTNIFSDKVCMLNDEAKSREAKKNKNQLVFVDRGYLSTLVYGMIRYDETKGKDRYDHILSWLINNKGGKLVEPDMYIWIDTKDVICMERAVSKARVLPENYWYKNLPKTRFYYQYLFQTIEHKIPLYKLNGSDSVSNNIFKIKQIIYENTTNQS